MTAVQRQHRRYQWRLGTGCVLGVAVLALAMSLATGGARKPVPIRVSSRPGPATRVVSCVQAWHTHEARILCARYAGPPVPVVITPPLQQAAGGPALCLPLPPGGGAAAPSPGEGRWHLATHLCRFLWWR